MTSDCSSATYFENRYDVCDDTLFPTMSVCPSGAHASVNASPRPLTSLKHALVRTSQKRTVPSLLTLHSSASLVGLKATLSMGAVWPSRRVENLTCSFSGFPATRQSARPSVEDQGRRTHSQLFVC